MPDNVATTMDRPQTSPRGWKIAAEIALVFAVFCVQGAWPVPEVNEPNYLGKAIHFWNPAWAPHDFFLQTADTHWVFYFTFGWLSRWLSPTALAWFGRLLTWGLMAWAWRRLSFAVAPQRWLAPLTAALFLAMIQHGNMAGEWVVGGVEAKGFAFVLVFLALESLVGGRWNRTLALLGAASAFHVLVGGWATVAAGIVWILSGRERPPLRSLWPGLLGGLIFSLPGLIPALLLNRGTPAEMIRQANELYVYWRLPHHLDVWKFPLEQLVPFEFLCLLWLVVGRARPDEPGVRRLRMFVVAALAISLTGITLSLLSFWDRTIAASVLRFYWFRLADFALPLGLSLLGAGWIVQQRTLRPAVFRWAMTAAVALAGFHLTDCVVMRLFSQPPHLDRTFDFDAWATAGKWIAHPGKTPIFPRDSRADRLPDYAAWLDACDWAAHNTPPDATFLTPRMSQTFKWYAQRSEAGDWKEVPQDARGLVEWWRRMQDFHATGSPIPRERWFDSLDLAGAPRLRRLAVQYKIDYILTTVSDPPLPLPVAYTNKTYVIYRMNDKKANGK